MEDEMKSNASLISVSLVSLEVILCFPLAKLITAFFGEGISSYKIVTC
jgi:hypothetical protein